MSDQTHPAERDTRVKFVRHALAREFGELLDVDDPAGRTAEEREALFSSRALAAKAVRISTDCTAEEAAGSVIDGPDDGGIDAIGFSPATPEIWLVQSRWSSSGTALLRIEDVQRMVAALRRLAEMQFDRFNPRFLRLADRVVKVLAQPGLKIHLVAAVLGEGHLSPGAETALREETAEFNRFGELVDLRVLGLADFHSAARRDAAPRPLTLPVTLTEGWFVTPAPYQAYVGTVAADELALWYQLHGERLFEGNLRRHLGVTSVNADLTSSLRDRPDRFWYFNNGITLLCERVQAEYFGRRAVGQPVRLELVGASVVNGAQTVGSVARAFGSDPSAVAEARVLIRVICVDGAPNTLAAEITSATNTQNRMEPRDFVALDPRQLEIRDEFAVMLDKEYVLKRGSLDPAPTAGCTVAEAAIALACAHRDSSLTARLLRDDDVLWRRAPNGVYSRLFGLPRPGALQIWRSVLLMRAVRQALGELSPALPPRARAICDNAHLLITHIVFRTIGFDGIDEADGDWESRLETALERTGRALSLLIFLVDRLYGPHAFIVHLLTDPYRCRELAAAVVNGFAEKAGAPDLVPAGPRRTRRPNGVALLVAHGRIPEGTRLMYRPGTATEAKGVSAWVDADPSRFLATWVDDNRRPLIWAVDGKRYSPSGLVMRIWEEAQWTEAPAAVQGTRCWFVPGQGSLVDLVAEIHSETAAGNEPDAP
ncbi:AIPR family protein [Streptomyces sp. NPDC002181]|uniref:AIPR family protein n=1 Tax=Streptomyces sp. NPDC002181 TaxID=3364635 RepID=UPI0036AC41AB